MDIFDEINDLIAQGDFLQAKTKLLASEQYSAENIDIQKTLGLLNVKLENFTEAKDNFLYVIDKKSDDATSWFNLATCLENTNDLIGAKSAYEKVIVLRENYIDAYKSVCMIYMQLNEHENAIEYANKAKKIDSDDYIFDYLIGTANISLKNYDESVRHLELALSLNPTHSKIYGNLGTAYLFLNNQPKTIEMYKRAIELEPNNSDILFNLGSVYQIQNNHSEACKYFEQAYEINEDERILIAMSLSELKGGNYTSAIEHYKILVVNHPEKDSFQYNLATCYEQVRDYGSAISILKRLVARNPKSINMVQKLAGLYVDTKDLRSAKELYDKIILKASPTAPVLYQYAVLSSQLFDTDTAERIFKKVIGLNPENAQAHKDLGVIYLNKRLFDYAKDEFEIALNLEPDNFAIVLEYANFLYSINNYIEADKYYDKALLIEDDVVGKTLQAMNKIELNQLDEAKALVDSALHQEPNHEYIQFMAGRIYFAIKDYEKAKRFLIFSVEQNPDIESQNLLALTYFALGEYVYANNIFTNLLEKNPKNVSLLFNSAQCFEKIGENDNALEILYTLTDIFPEHEEAQEMIRNLS